MAFDPDLPFELPSVFSYAVELTPELQQQRLEAHVALGELRARASLLPRIEVMNELLALEEAEGSCRIENIVTTQDSLYYARSSSRLGDQPKAEQEVLGYVEAFRQASSARAQAGQITLDMILEAQRRLVLDPLKHGIREGQVRIVSGGAVRQVIYTAPEQAQVTGLLSELVAYMNAPLERGSHDPLIKLALAHYQFESIHPFPDGNGRTGRLLNALMLQQTGLATGAVPYLSRWFQQERSSYYAGLNAPRRGDGFEGWVSYVLHGVSVTTRRSIERVDVLRDRMQVCAGELRKALGSRNREGLVEALFRYPYIRIEQVATELQVNRDTASALLKTATEAGILARINRGTSALFLNRFMVSEASLERAVAEADHAPRLKPRSGLGM